MTFSDLCTQFRLRGGAKQRLKKILTELERSGDFVKTRSHRYVVAARPKQIAGKLRYNRRGFGFVTPDDGSEDVFIAGENLAGALHGDKVLAEIDPSKEDRKSEGRVREILERGVETVVGVVRWDTRGNAYLEPFGETIPYAIQLLTPLPVSYQRAENPVVATRIDWDRSTPQLLTGEVIDVLGPLSNPSIDSKMVIYRNDLPHSFPEDVVEELRRLPEVILPSDITEREDLRHLPFVTIDGADARDHDDAIALEGSETVWVAIADVSHYVTPNRPIDAEAAFRSNSFYFPDLVIPMLPERLSNDLCSLRPNVDRLCLAAKLSFSKEGSLTGTHLCEAIIHSHARLTYEGVDRALAGREASDVPHEILPMMKTLFRIAEAAYRKRMSEGGIDFDLYETRVVLDQHGVVTAMTRRERTPAQRIVEEMMLAANKGVARTLSQANYPAIYRVHEQPDERKLADFLYVLQSYGYKIQLNIPKRDSLGIDQLLHRFDQDPRGKVFANLALRSMRQAFYSHQNLGHYGLGFADYLHFTSPIRRYADLVVHRSVRHFLRKERATSLFPKGYQSCEMLSSYISSQERLAQIAEREIRQIKGIRFFQDKVGQTFAGQVAGMVSQGLFVELADHAVEGFVHISKLQGDHYDYFEREKILRGRRGGKTYRLGDRLNIRVDEASIQDMRLNFSITSDGRSSKVRKRS